MEEPVFTPKIQNGLTNEQAEHALYMQVNMLLSELVALDEKCKEISPHLWWAVNKKLATIERNANDVKKGIHLYFHDGELYG